MKHYPSGMFPADVTPATKDKPAGKPLSEHHDRLNAIGRYLSPGDRAAALRYLEKRGLDDVAQMLGLVGESA